MAWPSASARTKTWGTEILTAGDLDGQLDLLHQYNNDQLNATTGHGHTGGTSDGKQLSLTTAVTGILPIANGGLNITTYTQGDILYSSATNVLSKLGTGTVNQVLIAGGASANPSWGSPTILALSYIKCSNTQLSGTGGGTATSGGWNTLTLNTKDIDTATIGSLSSNQLTIPAGTYQVSGSVSFFNTVGSQARLTGSGVSIIGTNAYATGSSILTTSLISGQFTIGSSTAIFIQYQVGSTVANSGQGFPNSFGTEVYHKLELWKIA